VPRRKTALVVKLPLLALKESSQPRRFALVVKLKLAGQQEAQEMEEEMGEWEDSVVDVVIGIGRALPPAGR
jgi:hypothetical protein